MTHLPGNIFLHSGHSSWVTGKLVCKSRTKNSRNVVKVLLERSETNNLSINQEVKFGSKWE